jgi:hypothetical protein
MPFNFAYHNPLNVLAKESKALKYIPEASGTTKGEWLAVTLSTKASTGLY